MLEIEEMNGNPRASLMPDAIDFFLEGQFIET